MRQVAPVRCHLRCRFWKRQVLAGPGVIAEKARSKAVERGLAVGGVVDRIAREARHFDQDTALQRRRNRLSAIANPRGQPAGLGQVEQMTADEDRDDARPQRHRIVD